MSWTARFLIAAGAFLVLAGAVAAFLVFHGTRSISSDRVQIDVQAPVSIASGDTVPLVITIHNSNPTALTNANLYVSLPEGTRAGDGTDAPFTQYNDVLGTVPAGADVTRTVQAKLFGPENAALPLAVKVEYHTDGSNALFVSQKQSSVTVATSPISVQVQTLSQSPSGQPLALTVLVRSNASAPVSDVAVLAHYPAGFSAQGADPAPSAANYFMLGTIAPGEQKVIKITGTLIGQNADQRVFRFDVGNSNPDGTSTLGNSYAQGSATVSITHPFLNVALSLNREATDPVIATPGEAVGALLSWQNTLADTLTNASIRVTFAGNALAQGSVQGGTGFYRSSDNSVIFASDTVSSLAALAPGATGAGSFSFAIKSPAALTGVTNPTITLSVSIAGQHAAGDSAPEALSSTLSRTIKIGTTVSLTSALSRTGTFANTGVVPPVAGKETTYTVGLAAKNTVNSVGAAKATMQLPSYVRYTGMADPGVSYNPDTRTVTWAVGDLAPNASAKANFQIAFLPSDSQANTSPVVVGEQTFTGIDRFTQQQVTSKVSALTDELPGSSGSGTVH